VFPDWWRQANSDSCATASASRTRQIHDHKGHDQEEDTAMLNGNSFQPVWDTKVFVVCCHSKFWLMQSRVARF
jgi:hypothetical protein